MKTSENGSPNPAFSQRIRRVLQERFGYSDFRPGQEEIIEAVCQRADVFAMMATGSGKSLCYQIPGYLLPGTVLVVSPLLSLMEDQVHSLRAHGENKVRALNGLIHPKERQRILRTLDRYKFLFISPEMLRKTDVLAALSAIRIALFVVDEAHCISQWGHDFRPDYLHLLAIRQRLHHPACLALTATAGQRVRTDIIEHLGLEQARIFVNSADRPNIALSVREKTTNEQKIEEILDLLDQVELPAIIYCSSRDWSERLAEIIREKLALRTAYYHGGMTAEDRTKIQNQFLEQQLMVLCCTNAFGMGVNMSHVRLVIHFQYPGNLNAYLQEIGRAGRDGAQSLAVLYHAPADDRLPEAFIDANYPEDAQLMRTLTALDQGKWDLNHPDALEAGLLEEGMSQTAARFILDQLQMKTEGHPFRSLFEPCKKEREARKKHKRRELEEMRQWLNEPGCRRAAYLRTFDETLLKRPQLCCDHCGLDFSAFKRSKKQLSSDINIDWRGRMDQLFCSPAIAAESESGPLHQNGLS
ncbi:MAG: ATP-dependent DNA helicase RecQ [Sporolactobacillus sp.]